MNSLKEISQTKSGKAFLVIWLLTLLAVMAIGVTGIIDHEIAEALAISAMVSGVLANICTIISYWSGAKSRLLAQFTWLALAVIALGSVLVLLNAGQKDADTILAYAMLVLSFPLGFIIGPMVGPMLSWDSSSSISIYWGICVVVGYLQWFVILPRVVAAMRGKDPQKVPSPT